MRAAEIEGQRTAEARLTALEDLATGAGMKFGQEYVDPKAKPRKHDEPYVSVAPYNKYMDGLRKQAYPWLFERAETSEEKAARLDQEQDIAFSTLFQALRA
jgi:hypothetical protein